MMFCEFLCFSIFTFFFFFPVQKEWVCVFFFFWDLMVVRCEITNVSCVLSWNGLFLLVGAEVLTSGFPSNFVGDYRTFVSVRGGTSGQLRILSHFFCFFSLFYLNNLFFFSPLIMNKCIIFY